MITRRELLKSAIATAMIRITKGEGEAMEQRISIITLGVKDLAASRRFYADGLGWKPVFENKEIVFFQAGGMIFALFLRDELAKDLEADPASFGRAAAALAHNVRTRAEVDPLIRRAAEAGATVLRPAREASWGGYSGYFADPDGFAWRWPGTRRGRSRPMDRLNSIDGHGEWPWPRLLSFSRLVPFKRASSD